MSKNFIKRDKQLMQNEKNSTAPRDHRNLSRALITPNVNKGIDTLSPYTIHRLMWHSHWGQIAGFL